MKSKKITVVVCILTMMLTVSAFVTTELMTPKKTEAGGVQFLIDFALASAKCANYIRNMSEEVSSLAYSDCMDWNLRMDL